MTCSDLARSKRQPRFGGADKEDPGGTRCVSPRLLGKKWKMRKSKYVGRIYRVGLSAKERQAPATLARASLKPAKGKYR
jgi:hypothetical protein